MQVRRFRLVLTLSLFGLLIAIIQPGLNPSDAASSPAAAPLQPVQVLKVGITEYQNIEDSYARYDKLFQKLAEFTEEPVSFEFAIGNYGEVMEWYNRGEIDVAVLSGMPVSKLLLEAGDDDLKKIDDAYIGDVSVFDKPDLSKSEIKDRFAEVLSKEDSVFSYRTVCLTLASDADLGTAKDGKPRTIEDIKQLWNNGKAEKPFKFLFVRPYSLSGYIIPRYILSKEYGINVTPDQMEFSYSHTDSLKKLSKEAQKPAGERTRYVAFVLEDTRYAKDPKDPQIFEQIDIGKLENLNIPREKVFVNHNLDDEKFQQYKTLMAGLFDNWKSDPDDLTVQLRRRSANWQQEYVLSKDAVKNVAVPRQLLYKTTIGELLEDFARYVDQPNTDNRLTPRLALVLSGGGAKCAYQAGAISAIEKKLRDVNKARAEASPAKPAIDINLVVGTSGGAINALLVAAGVTKAESAPDELASLWGSFRQQQFFQPSFRFNLGFGLCFGLLQALLITTAVLLFGRENVNWRAIRLAILILVLIEIVFAFYFGVTFANFTQALWWQTLVVGLTIIIVQGVGALITLVIRKHPKGLGGALKIFAKDPHHWRFLTVVLMIGVSLLEIFIAKCPGLEKLVTGTAANHWIDHGWMLVTLICNWSFPYPLVIGLFIAAVGAVVWRSFDWTTRRPYLVWALSVLLVIGATGLVMETFFRASAPSKATGIEDAFAEKLPILIQRTIAPHFVIAPGQHSEYVLRQISQKLMDPNASMLKRDLVITTSRLPIDQSDKVDQKQAELVNGLHDDLYFYFRANKNKELKPPLDRRFIPLKRNTDKLLDVVIGSSTIYPIFPSRALTGVQLGNEEKELEKIDRMSIVDGGYIHNIPIEAAVKWKATHIILIEASPMPLQSTPKDFWDNSMMAFGYLFNQAQLTDKLVRGATETFELRPTSFCEKQDTLPSCVGPSNTPDPNMDTFDFSLPLVRNAFLRGSEDVAGNGTSPKPLFQRVPGPPMFRTVAETPSNEKTGSAMSDSKTKQARNFSAHSRSRRFENSRAAKEAGP
jgi:predicted acylesterase/phospholipase RssA/ABC-type phosphate/phosphonate transport system substrate-binding protein